jgi:hypothetical protein
MNMGYEHGTVNVSPWSPKHVQAAWIFVIITVGEEPDSTVTAWADMLTGHDLGGLPS